MILFPRETPSAGYHSLVIKAALFLHCVMPFTFAKTFAGDHEDALYRYLMHNYTKEIRPTKDYFQPTNVTFGLLLHQIVDVNWMDEKLSWDEKDFGGVKLIHLPAEIVWKPDVILINNADPEYKDVIISTYVYIQSNGNVTWLVNSILLSSCGINVKYYPFDEQTCNLTFASWAYSGNELQLNILTDEGDISDFSSSTEWDLLSVNQVPLARNHSCCPNESWPEIVVSIHMSRKHAYYVFNQILPCALISSMAILGFYIPAETGEKITMCITTMLSMGVFLKTINENMPPTSEAVPLIGIYYGATLFIVCFATFANVITLKIHHRGAGRNPRPAPRWFRKVVLNFLARLLFIKVDDPWADVGAAKQAANKQSVLSGSDSYMSRALSRNTTQNSLHYNSGSMKSNHRNSNEKKASATLYRTKSSLKKRIDQAFMRGPKLSTATMRSHQPHKRRNYSTVSGVSTEPHITHPTIIPESLPFAQESIVQLKQEFEERFCRVLKKVYTTLEQNEARLAMQDRRSIVREEWRVVAIILDRILLFVFLVISALCTGIIIVRPMINQRYS